VTSLNQDIRFSVSLDTALNQPYGCVEISSKFGAFYSKLGCSPHFSGHKYVTLKVCQRGSPQAQRELELYKHFATLSPTYSGAILVRTLLDAFEIDNELGSYQCLVYEPLADPLTKFRDHFSGKVYPENVLQLTLTHILLALDFLHAEAKVVHTGMYFSLDFAYSIIPCQTVSSTRALTSQICRNRM
jgi:hypothetical protein